MDRVRAFIKINETLYKVHGKDFSVKAEGNVVKIFFNFSSGIRLLGKGARRIYAFESNWTLFIYYKIRPVKGLEVGSYESKAIIRYHQDLMTGLESDRLVITRADLVVGGN